MNADALTVTVNVRIKIADADVPLWRVRFLGVVARLLGIRLEAAT